MPCCMLKNTALGRLLVDLFIYSFTWASRPVFAFFSKRVLLLLPYAPPRSYHTPSLRRRAPPQPLSTASYNTLNLTCEQADGKETPGAGHAGIKGPVNGA